MLKNKVLKVVAVAIIITTLFSGFASAAFDFSSIGQFVNSVVVLATGTDADADLATGTDADADLATGTDADVNFTTGTDADADFTTGTDADAEEEEEETCIFKKMGCIICKILMFIFGLFGY